MFQVSKKVIEQRGDEITCPGLSSECEITLHPENAQSTKLFAIPTSARHTITIGNTCDYYGALMEECVMGMKAGELSEFEAKFVCADAGKNPDVCFTLELHTFTSGQNLYEVSVADRTSLAERWKNIGNTFFKSGDICMAGYWYSKALKALLSCKTDPEALAGLQDSYKNIICACYINLAAVQLKRKLFHHAAENCTRCLEFDAYLMKALFRRAQAYEATNSFHKAAKDLRLALEIEPKSGVARALLESVIQRAKETDKQSL